MPIYEYKGQQYEIDTNDPEVAKSKILRYLETGKTSEPKSMADYGKDFLKGTASLADTAINAVTGTLDYAAYPLARAAGRTPEQAQKETTSPKDVIGRAFGITEDPAYTGEASRRIAQGVGEAVNTVAVQPAVQATGLPEQDVANMLGSLTIAAPKVAKAAVQPVKPVVQGFREGLRNPDYVRNTETAFAPLQETYYPARKVDEFMAAPREQRPGMLPELEASRQPRENLFTTTPQMLARNLGPKSPTGETLIPYRGETRRAFGEQLARDISNRPGTAGLTEIGGAVLGGLAGGIPGALAGAAIAPGLRLAQLGALQKIGKTAGFTRGFPEELQAAQQAQRQGAMQQPSVMRPTAIAPTIAAGQAGGATMTAPTTQRPPMTPPPRPTNPAELSQQLAVEKLTQQRPTAPISQQAPQTPVMQPQPVAPTPVPSVVRRQPPPPPQLSGRSSQTIRQELDSLSRQSDELYEQRKELGTRYGTKEGEQYQQQLGQLNTRIKALERELEEVTKAEKKSAKQQSRPSKKAPSNVSNMITDEQAQIWNRLRAGESELEQSLARMTQQNRDILEGNLRKYSSADDPMMQQYLSLFDKYRIK